MFEKSSALIENGTNVDTKATFECSQTGLQHKHHKVEVKWFHLFLMFLCCAIPEQKSQISLTPSTGMKSLFVDFLEDFQNMSFHFINLFFVPSCCFYTIFQNQSKTM